MKALIDGDILCYELGFSAEAVEDTPSWGVVEAVLMERFYRILSESGCDDYAMFLTAPGPGFRDAVATTRPYKGNRKSEKPFHYSNIRAVLKAHFNCEEATDGYEADDLMAMESTANPNTVVCSRDKDLFQLPGQTYSWAMGRQKRYGPADGQPSLMLSEGKLLGRGNPFFYGQLLTGDRVDNIPGLPRVGPAKAAAVLEGTLLEEMPERVESLYRSIMGDEWLTYLTEMGRLLWLVRKPDDPLYYWGLEKEYG